MERSEPGSKRSHFQTTVACVWALLAVNVYLIRELFTTEYTKHLDSIEAAYISISHMIMSHWHDRLWWPLWYCGIPFQNTYPPLLHNLVAAVADLGGMSAALAHHAVTAAMYCLGPVTLFFLALRLSGSRAAAFAAALLLSVFSTSAVLIPSVRHDMGTIFGPRKLHALLQYGEGPHITSMTLLPIPILLMDLAFETRRPLYWVLSAVAMVFVVLTNWLGAFALAAAVIAYLWCRTFRWTQRAAVAALGVYAYALASPWIPPATLLAVRTNAQRVGGAYTLGKQHLLYLVCAIATFSALVWLLNRTHASALTRFALLFFGFMGALTLCAEYFGIFLLPQPERYHLEMEMAIALLLGCGWAYLQRHSSRGQALALIAVSLAFCFYGGIRYRRYARELIQPVAMENTIEYQSSRWIGSNLPGSRVMVPGTISFWMNAFADNPQLMGGFDQGIVNPLLPVVHYQLYSGMGAGDRGTEVAQAWLRVYGVRAILVGGPHSREFYKPYQNIGRFAGWPELWRSGDDAIYGVPSAPSSPVHAIRPEELVRSRSSYAFDISPLRNYLAALDRTASTPGSFEWKNWHSASARARLQEGEILSVQISYHPGWSAESAGRRVRVSSDALGLMVLEPECEGDCEVDLKFDGGLEMAVATGASTAALATGLLWIGVSGFRRRRSAQLNGGAS